MPRAACAWPSDQFRFPIEPSKPGRSLPDRRLPKSARLNEGTVFVELLRGRRKAIGPLELASRERLDRREGSDASGKPDEPGGPGGRHPASGAARIGIVVGRKNLSRAVDRNALKRIVREAFRSQRAQLPSRDLLIRLRQRLKGVPRKVWKFDVINAVNELLVVAAQALPPSKPARNTAQKSAQTSGRTSVAGSGQ